MDRKLDASQDLLYEVKSLIDNNKVLELRELIEEYHIIDIFDIMENLEEDMKIQLFEVLPLDMASSILEEGSVEFFISILSKLDVEHSKNILELMSLGDMADKLSELEEEEREHIINLLNQENADYVKELLFYDEDSAGGTMTTGYISINKDMTALEAIDHIYVVDDEEKLVGVLSLRELIIARDANIVEDLMSENIISVYVDEDREEAVRLVSKYNLIAIPVVDRQEKLKGIITVDDIIDVMEEEATEDMYKFAGSSEHEREVAEKENPTLREQIISALRGRLPWLIITLVGGLLASLILSNLDYIMNPVYAPLVFFIPVVIGMGGNIGTQSSSVTVITLSNKDLNFSNVVREGIVGIITGLLCSIITGIVIYFVMRKLDIVLIVSISLFINMVLGATIGAFMPVLLKKMDADPSTVSSPIISTALDITGIAVYFIITTALLSKIV